MVKSTSFLLLATVLIVGACSRHQKYPLPNGITAIEIENPLGLNFNDFRFEWLEKENDTINSFQVLVASDPLILKKDIGDLWNSGRIFTTDNFIRYGGTALKPGQKAWWKIKFWNINGQESNFSPAKRLPISDESISNRVVLVGGSLISRMELFGYFETRMLAHWPNQDLTFRNIGWPADDVYGMARSQFGSAQNTRSWKPPTPEEGFGSRLLMQHIMDAEPTTLVIGYGPEMAFAENDTAFNLFYTGYERLLNFADSLQVNLVLLTPPKQEAKYLSVEELTVRNEKLSKTRNFILQQAQARNYKAIDLFEKLITDPVHPVYTMDGLHLNDLGQKKLAQILLESSGLSQENTFQLQLFQNGAVDKTNHVLVGNWSPTVKGVKFETTTTSFFSSGMITVDNPFAVYLEGNFAGKSEKALVLKLPADSVRINKVRQLVLEKNKMHRYRIQPLNEAYIYLFRRHEMGHLAYEMEDFKGLIREKEAEIRSLLTPVKHQIELELFQPYRPPKTYMDSEVPVFMNAPDIEKEIIAFKMPDGFSIELFAADPMIANPININWDTRGRAWVATSSTYPHIVPGKEPNDKLVILEDTDGDGKADKSTVFADSLLIPHSVMPVPGGAYVTCSTQFLFLGDEDGDDVADSETVIFDGFGNADVHHTIHGLRWAPWGDLYFTQSIYINTFTETAYGPRRLNGSGTWRFRPETERLEIYSRGLVNPWGFAFDKWGQTFATDGAGNSGVSYVFPESAHTSAVGVSRILPGLNKDKPKNTAAEIMYSKHFPDNWQNSLIANDYRANRTIRYEIRPEGSGYVAKEVETILHSDHRAYRPVDIKIGPDGAMYIVDWYNYIINHGEVDFHHPLRDRTHGRIWRLVNNRKPLNKIPKISEAGINELLSLLKSPEQFTRIQANRELVSRKIEPERVLNWANSLSPGDSEFEHHQLEALWLCAAINYYPELLLKKVLASKHPHARAAGVRMIGHWGKQQELLEQLERLVSDANPQVRLETLHALRTFKDSRSAELAIKVLDLPMDINLDFASWLTIKELKSQWLPKVKQGKPVFEGDKNKLMYALVACHEVEVIQFVKPLMNDPDIQDTLKQQAWYLMADEGDGPTLEIVLDYALKQNDIELLKALANAPASNLSVPNKKEGLKALLAKKDPELNIAAIQLAGRWKARELSGEIEKMATDPKASMEQRIEANRALLAMDLMATIQQLAKKNDLSDNVKAAATVVWAEKGGNAAAENAASLLESMEDAENAEVIFRAFTRFEGGAALLNNALKNRKLKEYIANAGLRVVQTSGVDMENLDATIREIGGIQPIGIELSAQERKALLDEAMASGNRGRGRNVYRKTELLCASCHRIDGVGGVIGPDLSSVGTYLSPGMILESIVKPSAIIKQGYETVNITKNNGQIITGVLQRKTDKATLLRISNGDIISVANAEIQKTEVSPVSLMPPGLTASLNREELKDLIYYLGTLGVEN